MQDILTIMEDMCSQMHNVGNNRIVADAHGNVEEVNHYYPYEGTEKVPFFYDQNGKCLRFVTSLSANRLK